MRSIEHGKQHKTTVTKRGKPNTHYVTNLSISTYFKALIQRNKTATISLKYIQQT